MTTLQKHNVPCTRMDDIKKEIDMSECHPSDMTGGSLLSKPRLGGIPSMLKNHRTLMPPAFHERSEWSQVVLDKSTQDRFKRDAARQPKTNSTSNTTVVAGV